MSDTTRSSDQAVTLTIDIGGTGIKMITVDHQGKPTSERLRELTPDPATPDALLALIGAMLEVQPTFDRVSVGFPGVVVRGVTKSAPNLELAHHPFEKGKTYEQRLGDAALDRAGKKRWRQRVARMVRLLDRVFNADLLHIGGGNARKLRAADLPGSVRVFDNVEGMTGGVRLWQVE